MKCCLNCGKEIQGKVKKYCDNYCQMKFQSRKFIERWKLGLENGGTYVISKHIRNYLIEKYGEKCSICGWNEKNIVTGKSPLEVHHIDGDYKNNSEENLIILCPNCHSLTETYKALNPNGRDERKKYNGN